ALLVLGTAGLSLYTYLAMPFWNIMGWLFVNVRFSVPFLCISTAAAGAFLARCLRWESREFLVLALGCMAVDAQALDRSVPGLSPGFSDGLLLASAGLGAIVLLLRDRLGVSWKRLWPAALMAAVLLPLPLLHFREARRYEQYRTEREVHHSQHDVYAGAALF